VIEAPWSTPESRCYYNPEALKLVQIPHVDIESLKADVNILEHQGQIDAMVKRADNQQNANIP
jgi:3-methyladenine DNA glycosylase Tag